MKTAPVKTDRDNGSFSIISLTEYQEALSEGNLENKLVILTLELTFAHEALILSPTQIRDFFRDISLDN